MSTRRRRPAVAGLTVLAPLAVWLVADPLLGHRQRIVDGDETLGIGAVAVVLVALPAALGAWGLLAALERFGVRRARTVWTAAAAAVLALSALPLTGGGMTGGTRTVLALMHLSVVAVLIPGLRSTAAPAPPQRLPAAFAGKSRRGRRRSVDLKSG